MSQRMSDSKTYVGFNTSLFKSHYVIRSHNNYLRYNHPHLTDKETEAQKSQQPKVLQPLCSRAGGGLPSDPLP